jgi:hypothetical protein
MERSITLAGKEYVLRYDLRGRRDVEKQLGKGLWTAFQDGTVESSATILWAGMRHASRKLTPDDVMDLFQAHTDAGGEWDDAIKVAVRAMFEAKLFGKEVDAKMVDRILGDEDGPEGKDVPPATVKAAE